MSAFCTSSHDRFPCLFTCAAHDSGSFGAAEDWRDAPTDGVTFFVFFIFPTNPAVAKLLIPPRLRAVWPPNNGVKLSLRGPCTKNKPIKSSYSSKVHIVVTNICCFVAHVAYRVLTLGV